MGTHLDKIQQGRRKERLFEWEREIFRRYDKKGFPWIGGNVFISNTTGEGLHRLKEAIHKVATKMQDFNLHEPVIGKKVRYESSLFNDISQLETCNDKNRRFSFDSSKDVVSV